MRERGTLSRYSATREPGSGRRERSGDETRCVSGATDRLHSLPSTGTCINASRSTDGRPFHQLPFPRALPLWLPPWPTCRMMEAVEKKNVMLILALPVAVGLPHPATAGTPRTVPAMRRSREQGRPSCRDRGCTRRLLATVSLTLSVCFPHRLGREQRKGERDRRGRDGPEPRRSDSPERNKSPKFVLQAAGRDRVGVCVCV